LFETIQYFYWMMVIWYYDYLLRKNRNPNHLAADLNLIICKFIKYLYSISDIGVDKIQILDVKISLTRWKLQYY